jgi:hypothetical protein
MVVAAVMAFASPAWSVLFASVGVLVTFATASPWVNSWVSYNVVLEFIEKRAELFARQFGLTRSQRDRSGLPDQAVDREAACPLRRVAVPQRGLRRYSRALSGGCI